MRDEDRRDAELALQRQKLALEAVEALDSAGVERAAHLEVGVMIEVPAAALMSREIGAAVDFFSIGTNDLIQYTLAIDRADEAVAHLYDPLHPAVLQLISQSIAQARAAGKGVSVEIAPLRICGCRPARSTPS